MIKYLLLLTVIILTLLVSHRMSVFEEEAMKYREISRKCRGVSHCSLDKDLNVVYKYRTSTYQRCEYKGD